MLTTHVNFKKEKRILSIIKSVSKPPISSRYISLIAAKSIILSALIGYIISDVIFMPLRGTSRYIVSGLNLNRGIGCTGVVIHFHVPAAISL